MIGYLSGTIKALRSDSILLEVGGVGYRVEVNERTVAKLPASSSLSLWIHTHVREDDIRLFGFAREEELSLFEKLIAVNGIGPKLALAILAGLEPDELTHAILTQDIVRLSSVPGIGRKTAERLAIELKDKLALPHDVKIVRRLLTHHSVTSQALSALTNLGYNRSDAERAITLVPQDPPLDLETTIKTSLAILARGILAQNALPQRMGR